MINQNFQILLSENATLQENYAATELRHYLNFMTCTAIEIVTEKNSKAKFIAIGQAAKEIGLERDSNLGVDGFTVKTIGENIGIVGGKRGVIYGVYELLEHMGCRFFTPVCEKIPLVENFKLLNINTTQKPVLEYRDHSYKDFIQSPRFAVKSRINFADVHSAGFTAGRIPEDMGGGTDYSWFVHSFDRIIHPDEYFDTNPEYFSMVDGKRLKEFSQLCLTNPDVLKISIEKVREALLKKPSSKIISISANDWYNYCTCPDCAALDALEGSCAGSLITYVNKIAEALEPEFPDVVFDTLAYQHTRQAPKQLRPRYNVCVRLCSIESCFSHSFETCDDDTRRTARPDGTRTNFIEDLRDWARVCDRLYIWDYTTGFAHYPAPHANWNTLQPNMRSFVKNNVKGIYEQACGAFGGSTDLNELRAYIIGKLLWNAECDVKKHMEEFCEYYYGKAAPFILGYIKALTDKVEKDNIHTGFNEQCDKAYLTDDMLDIYDEFFAKAEKAVIGDAIRHMRVAKARLSIRWVRLKNNHMLKGIVDHKEVNDFFTDWRAHGLTRIDEWASAESTLRAMLHDKWRGTEFLRHWTDEGPERL